MNKVLIRMCILYYNKCWKHRNKAMNNKKYQIQRVKTWYNNEQIITINRIHEQPRYFAIQIGLNTEIASINEMKKQIYRLKKIHKKSENHKSDDIRRYFVQKLNDRNYRKIFVNLNLYAKHIKQNDFYFFILYNNIQVVVTKFYMKITLQQE